MKNEKRRSQRKPLERRVWVDRADGLPPIECGLGNMSDTGAKLIFAEPPQLPDEFVLLLSVDGRVARKCRLAWKDEKSIGVQFTAKLVTGGARAMQASEA